MVNVAVLAIFGRRSGGRVYIAFGIIKCLGVHLRRLYILDLMKEQEGRALQIQGGQVCFIKV